VLTVASIFGVIKRELPRRSAIETVIGHLKTEGHLRRYRLCGQAGNPTPSIEHNLRRLFSRG